MKRILFSIFLVLCLIVGAVACNSTPERYENTSSDASSLDSSSTSSEADNTPSEPSGTGDGSSIPSDLDNASSASSQQSTNNSSGSSTTSTTSGNTSSITSSNPATTTTPTTPSEPEIEASKNILSVGQLRLSDGTGGMSYVITLKDEGFIIIDGGMGNNYFKTHSKTLYNYLKARTPEGEKPVILGWFATHFHNDHVENVAQFLKQYSNELDVKGFYINHPGKDNYTNRQTGMEKLVAEAMNCYPNVTPHYLKKDEKIEFPHCTVDVLVTSDYIGSDRATDPNAISAIFKLNFDTGKSFLVTGDTTLTRVIDLFSSNTSVYHPIADLKCDIYQVPHHGRPLGYVSEAAKLKEYYKLLGIKIVFIPVPKVQLETVEYYTDSKWADNYYLIYDSGATVFHHSETVTVNMADLTYTVE